MLAVPTVAATPLFADPTFPTIGGGTYNITTYGATTSSTDNSAAINAAINDCISNGGGTVVIPSGTFLSDPLAVVLGTLPNGFELDVQGTLQAVPASDPSWATNATFFSFNSNAKNVLITGGGDIDGNGGTWYPTTNSNNNNNPTLIKISNGQTVAVQNISITNSPKITFSFSGSQTTNITFNNATITAPATSNQTDGIDLNGTNWLVENSSIATGDDDIAIKSAASGENPPNNVTIKNMTIGSGHGISIGGQTNGGVNNVTVNNVTFNGTDYGIRLKAGRNNGGVVNNVSFNNITMTNVPNSIYLSSWYNGSGFNSPSNANTATNATNTAGQTPVWKNITINNVSSTGTSVPLLIYGLPESPFQTVTVSNSSFDLGKITVNYAGYTGAFPGNSSFGVNDIKLINDIIAGHTLVQADTASSTYFVQPNKGLFDAVVEISQVPEPTTAAMMVLAPAALLRRRRTKKA